MSIIDRIRGKNKSCDRETLLNFVFNFFKVDTRMESRRMLEDHPELLNDETDSLIENFINAAIQINDRSFEQMLKSSREMLLRCRKFGISQAFDKLESSENGMSTELQSIIFQLSRPVRSRDALHRIQLCKKALSMVPQEQNPSIWAGLHVEMGIILAHSSDINLADNIELAIDHYYKALEVYGQLSYPYQWATTHNNLGTAYWLRIRGDRVDNIEQAIRHYNEALKVRRFESRPSDWAATQNNLANAYRDRKLGDQIENNERAIRHYKESLRIFDEYSKNDLPMLWAAIQMNLGNAYCVLTDRNRDNNIENGIWHYKEALSVYLKETSPIEWSRTQNNLANAYLNRLSGNKSENIECALQHYNDALKVITLSDEPTEWAQTQSHLANAYSIRIEGDRAENVKNAIQDYNEAFRIYNPNDFPKECRNAARNLGDLYSKEGRWQDAAKIYQLATEAADKLYQASIFLSSRDAELNETGDLYRCAAYSWSKSGQDRDAVILLERGLARGLGDALARDRADLERVRKKDLEAYELYIQVVQELQSLESLERAGASGEEKALPPRDLMMQAWARLDEALDRIRRIPGYERFLKDPGWKEIVPAVVEGQPLVYLASTPTGGMALIVHHSLGSHNVSVEAVSLKGFSEQRLQELLDIWFEAYDGWIESITDAEIDYDMALRRWFDSIESVTGSLWQEVIEPVYTALQSLKPEQAFLIPTGLLSLLPLHAAWHEEGGRRQYFQDLLPVSYIPSARALIHARRTARAASAERLLAIDEPSLLKPSPLPNSHDEVLAISSLFQNPLILEHEKATRGAALQALPAAEVAHFSCHGGANWSDPENSGLFMANGEMLTVKDLFELHLVGARLATLSACETGVPGIELPDEVVSLPSAFIRAGFAGAIGSLWTVSDKSTAMLMTRFYQLWRTEGKPPVQALAEAQKELRDDERFRHPFYWAAFYMTGV